MKKRFLLLTVIFFVLAYQSVNAQEISPFPTPTPVPYELPYPGILSGNPLYGLKLLRDSFLGFFISNPLKKAEYDLLQADKNLQATVLLIQQKADEKTIMAMLTLSENDFERALIKTEEAKKQGMNTTVFLSKLDLANKKHQEVIGEIIKSTKGDLNKEAVRQLEKTKELGKTVVKEELN